MPQQVQKYATIIKRELDTESRDIDKILGPVITFYLVLNAGFIALPIQGSMMALNSAIQKGIMGGPTH